MQDDSMVRCIQAACGHSLPRRVNFCPYCGTPQGAASTRVTPAPMPVPAPAPAADTPPPVPVPPPAAQTAAPAPAPAPLPPPPAAPRVPPPSPQPSPPLRSSPAPGASLPKREPVRLRWWLLALAVLWAIWLWAKPSNRRIEAQMDKAIALATECKARDAQSELIALRKTKATPEQLQKVQAALNEASAACTRKRQRDKAWREAKPGIQSAMASSSFERARTRLRAFTKRWGEDDETRAMKDEIDTRAPEHRRADEVAR